MAQRPQYSDTMTPEQRNALRDFIQSPTGEALLRLMLNQEVALKAEAWTRDTTTDRQIQLVNQEFGIYWVRTLIQDLITPPQKPLHEYNGE
jgi:hypothetical protein